MQLPLQELECICTCIMLASAARFLKSRRGGIPTATSDKVGCKSGGEDVQVKRHLGQCGMAWNGTAQQRTGQHSCE
jgi:hypothetical protein